MTKDVLESLRGLLANRTEDPGCYEFVLECWIESAADEIERLRELVAGMQAAIETAGLIYRNTDSGPNLVHPRSNP